MNTKPTPKRYKPPPGFGPKRPFQGWFLNELQEPRFTAALAQIASKFVFLEHDMRYVLAVLLGGVDPQVAGYVLRAIKSPKGRVDVMTDLLQLAPHNMNRPDIYDQVIRDFSRASNQRNKWVHGQWWTNEHGSVWIAEEDEHGLGFQNKREVKIEELWATDAEIGKLMSTIRNVIAPDLQKLGIPPPPEPQVLRGEPKA